MSVPTDRRPRLLVADDSRDLRDALVMILRDEGYRAVPAADGLEALELAERERPDVIVLDVAMPRLDGPGFCRAYRGRGGTAPIVLITAALRVGIAEVRKGAAACGAAALLVMPFSIEKLLEAVGRLIVPAALPEPT